MEHKITTIDEYIAGFPEDVQAKMQKIRAVIREEAPTATEKISYGMPTFHLHKNLVHFAAYKHHIGFYPTPTGLEEFKELLKGYETSKGTVRFPLDREIPYDLVRKITAFRVSEVEKNAK